MRFNATGVGCMNLSISARTKSNIVRIAESGRVETARPERTGASCLPDSLRSVSIFIPLFQALNDSGARYIVVGGFAVVLHGHARLTADLDLVIDLEQDAARRVVETLASRGLEPRAPVAARDFADPKIRKSWIDEKGMQVFSMFDPANPLLTVDLFVSHPLPFEEMFARSEIFEAHGVELRVASIPDLIALKKLSRRPEDLHDIEALEEILRLRTESEPNDG